MLYIKRSKVNYGDILVTSQHIVSVKSTSKRVSTTNKLERNYVAKNSIVGMVRFKRFVLHRGMEEKD